MRQLEVSVDVEALRTRLQAMSDDELMQFGNEMKKLVYPPTYEGNGKPKVSAFSIQLNEARDEWLRRHLRNPKA